MFTTTKKIVLGSCAFRQPNAKTHCRFLHGYNLVAKFEFKATSLDDNGWVIDFGSFNELKASLRNTFDHKTVITGSDPELPLFDELSKKGIIDLRVLKGVGIEYFAEYCLQEANQWLDMKSQLLLSRKVWCSKVEVWEHDLNSAIYENKKG